MRWESGEGLRGRALPDRGDAKLGMASTCNQITASTGDRHLHPQETRTHLYIMDPTDSVFQSVRKAERSIYRLSTL